MKNLLILHGWGSCAKNWARVRELLEKEEIKVFLPDLPGFGENPALKEPWSIDDYVNWVKKYCEKNNLSQTRGELYEPFFLLGHSFGGAISLKYSLQFPKDIKKLILVNPAIIRVRRKIVERLTKRLKVFSFLPFYSFLRRAFYRFIVKSDYPDTEGPMRETYLRIVKQDFSEYLSSVSVPTVLIWGNKDSVTPFKYARFVKEKIVGVELKILPDIHHDPHSEAPELLVKKILENIM